MFISVREFADVLKLSESTVIRLIKEGEVRAVKLGRQYRIHESELDAIKDSKLVETSP